MENDAPKTKLDAVLPADEPAFTPAENINSAPAPTTPPVSSKAKESASEEEAEPEPKKETTPAPEKTSTPIFAPEPQAAATPKPAPPAPKPVKTAPAPKPAPETKCPSFVSQLRAFLNAMRRQGVVKRHKRMEANLDKIMAHARETGRLTHADVERLAGVKHTHAVNYLDMLVRDKKLVRFGYGKKTFYRPVRGA